MAVIALVAAAMIALTVSLDIAARSCLRYRAGKRAVDTAESNDQAMRTYRMLHSSLSWRWLRSVLGPSDAHGENDENGGGGAGER